MKVAILGSGVIGTTTAYYLVKAGHEVTVYDRQGAAGLETSFANAGEISPGYASPWASPTVPRKILGWLSDPHGPFRLYPQWDSHQWRWLWQMLMNCTRARYTLNKERMQRVATYARECLRQLRAETGIEYDGRQQGTLEIFRRQKEVDAIAKDLRVLQALGIAHEVLDRAGCVAVEPGLAIAAGKIAGGLRLPHDETGDCFLFTQRLSEQVKVMGGQFAYNTPIQRLETEKNRITGVRTQYGVIQADAYVVALGSYSPWLTRPIGVNLPVYPVKGYSLTVPILDPAYAPVSTIMDERYKVGVTRLGARIRVAGTAEISGYNHVLREPRLAMIRYVLQDLFPGGGNFEQVTYWTGLRAMTPDGTPIVGKTHYPNLFINTGHGTLGWTMSCGTGKLLADIISGSPTDISTEGLSVARYR